MNYIFITGGTGFVGSNLCTYLLKDNQNHLFLLCRAKGTTAAQDRMMQQLEKSMKDQSNEGWQNRVTVLDGDIKQPQLGLSQNDFTQLIHKTTAIYHCAATIKFGLPYEEAKQTNCGGTDAVLELLRQIENPKFTRLNYVSTAYIAGSITNGFGEGDLNQGQSFNNTYEQTKFECEEKLKRCMDEENLPITIFRPSIVSSSSEDGSTHKNNIIFKFLKLFCKGKIGQFYCDDTSSANIVPVDYFIKAMVTLAQREDTLHKTYNLVNQYNCNVKETVSFVCKLMHIEEPVYHSFENIHLHGNNSLTHFFNYMRLSHHFEDGATRKALEGTDIICVKADGDYFKKNIEFCLKEKML